MSFISARSHRVVPHLSHSQACSPYRALSLEQWCRYVNTGFFGTQHLKLVPHLCEVVLSFPQGSRSQASFTEPLAGSHISHGQRRRYVTTGSKCFTPFFVAGSHRVFPRLCASQACSTGKALSPGTSTPVLEDRPSGVSLSYFSPQPLTGLLASPGTLTGAVLPVRHGL